MSMHQIETEITDVRVRSEFCNSDRKLENFIRNLICEIETDYENVNIKSISSIEAKKVPNETCYTVAILFSYIRKDIIDT